MPWPTEELKRRFNRPENAALLRYLEECSPHAHSDIGALVLDVAKRMPGAKVFGPNITACSYVFAYTGSGVAFILAVDMRSLLLRLPGRHPGTSPFEKIGPGWYELDPFDPQRGSERNARRVREMASAAFAHAQKALPMTLPRPLARASVYRRDRLIVHADCQTESGFHAASPPFLVLPIDAPRAKLGDAILAILAQAGLEVPDPVDAKSILKPLLDAAGVKSYARFVTGAVYCAISSDGETIAAIPTDHGGKPRAFRHHPERAVRISAAAAAEDVGAVVLRALDLSR